MTDHLKEQLAPPKVKLLTLWMLDAGLEEANPIDHTISHGVWETRGVTAEDGKRVYDMVCVWPHHSRLNRGDRRRMREDVIIVTCHRVRLEHLPKEIDAPEWAKKDWKIHH